MRSMHPYFSDEIHLTDVHHHLILMMIRTDPGILTENQEILMDDHLHLETHMILTGNFP